MKPFHLTLIVATMCAAVLASCGGGGGGKGAPKEFTTKIRGTVVDRPDSKALTLSRAYEDLRVTGVEIPIVDGRFEYDLVTNTREEWSLAFDDELSLGSWMPVNFFSEPGTVEFTLHPQERYGENTLAGGPLNTEYAAYRDSVLMWEKIKREEGMKIVERGYEPTRRMFSEGKTIIVQPDTSTPEARALHEEWLALEKRTLPGRKIDYIRDNPSIVSYAGLYSEIRSGLHWDETLAKPYIDIYNETGYAEKFPDSPYTREIANMLGALGNIRVGGRYIDLTLPDLDGNEVTLSERIDGKVALIDLWMTWCGPCRRAAIEAIPLYAEFGERGFTVIGVSGDSDPDAIRSAAEKDGYPWPTLVDLNGAAEVWSRYGISGAGGSNYLVDRDGTILAVNPDAEQLRKILEEKLPL